MIRDIIQRFLYPKISEKELIWGTRFFLVIFGAIAYALVGFYPRVLEAAFAAYTMYGASITPALMAIFFWKRVTPIAGTISIFMGISVTMGWEIWGKIVGTLPFGLPAIYPALCAAVVALIGVSILTNSSSENVEMLSDL